MTDIISVSYLNQRRIIGLLGFIFPVILVVARLMAGMFPVEPTLSDYYHTNARDIFVGVLVAIGLFLLAYEGYDRWDRRITSAAGFFMVCIAAFPSFGGGTTNYLFQFLSPKTNGILHVASAVSAFFLLGVMSFFQFTKSGTLMSQKKKQRNRIYRICGIVIWITMVIMLILNKSRYFIVLECIVLWAFAFSWIVKGWTLLKG